MSVTLAPVTVERRSLADTVYERLLEAIVRGTLAPGADLSVASLAAELQVSRTPVTEAIQRLCYDGLVEQSLNHQAQVCRPTLDDVREIYQMRIALEGAAAELAAEHLSDDLLAELRRALKQLWTRRKHAQWATEALDFDARFHEAIARGAGNGRLSVDIARYRRLMRCFCRLTASNEVLRSVCREHQAVLVALESRRPVAARRAMVKHIESRLAAVTDWFHSQSSDLQA